MLIVKHLIHCGKFIVHKLFCYHYYFILQLTNTHIFISCLTKYKIQNTNALFLYYNFYFISKHTYFVFLKYGCNPIDFKYHIQMHNAYSTLPVVTQIIALLRYLFIKSHLSTQFDHCTFFCFYIFFHHSFFIINLFEYKTYLFLIKHTFIVFSKNK